MINVDQPPEIIHKVVNFIKNPQGYFLLSGTNGTGKTYLAKTIYEKLSHFKLPDFDDEESMFFTQANLNIKWNAQMTKYSDTTYFLNLLLKTKLLILDDLGTRTPSDPFMDFLYNVFDDRYNNKNIGTVITTNLSSDDIKKKFGSAILSRIASGINIRIDGKDRRKPS